MRVIINSSVYEKNSDSLALAAICKKLLKSLRFIASQKKKSEDPEKLICLVILEEDLTDLLNECNLIRNNLETLQDRVPSLVERSITVMEEVMAYHKTSRRYSSIRHIIHGQRFHNQQVHK